MRESYFDTSVLGHAYDSASPHCKAARDLLREETANKHDRPVATPLVLGELYSVLTKGKGRKDGKPLMDHAQAIRTVESLRPSFDLHGVAPLHLAEAFRVKRTQFQQWGIWDAMHWAAALQLGCTRFYTLDFPGGLEADEEGRYVLEGVEFVDPFR